MAHSLMRYLGLSSPAELAEFGFPSAGDLVDIISRVRSTQFYLASVIYRPSALFFAQFITNAFIISTPSLTPLGVSISPLIALINHSCDPNAVIVFPRSPSTPPTQEPLMQVIALRPIAPDEEVQFFLPPICTL
jgi:hypothetical protein